MKNILVWFHLEIWATTGATIYEGHFHCLLGPTWQRLPSTWLDLLRLEIGYMWLGDYWSAMTMMNLSSFEVAVPVFVHHDYRLSVAWVIVGTRHPCIVSSMIQTRLTKWTYFHFVWVTVSTATLTSSWVPPGGDSPQVGWIQPSSTKRVQPSSSWRHQAQARHADIN